MTKNDIIEDTIEDYEWAKLSGKMLKTSAYSEDRKEVITKDMTYPQWKSAINQRKSLRDILASKFKHIKRGF